MYEKYIKIPPLKGAGGCSFFLINFRLFDAIFESTYDVLHVSSLRACEAIQIRKRRHYFSI